MHRCRVFWRLESNGILSLSKFLQDSAMVQMRENLFFEKQKAIETIRGDLDKGRSRTEERLQKAALEHQKILKVSQSSF